MRAPETAQRPTAFTRGGACASYRRTNEGDWLEVLLRRLGGVFARATAHDRGRAARLLATELGERLPGDRRRRAGARAGASGGARARSDRGHEGSGGRARDRPR